MLIDTKKKLNENEKADALYIITSLNTCLDYLGTIQDFSILTEQQMLDYWSGICDTFIEARMNEYKWRKEISKKYEVPYTFISRNGDLLLDEPYEEE